MNNILEWKSPFLKKWIIFICLFMIFSIFYLGVVLTQPYTSDHASLLMEDKSIMEGNVLLKGWTLSTVSYYTTEVPFYIIGMLFFGFSDKVIYFVTAINYALLSAILIYLCCVSREAKIKVTRLITSICFLLFLPALLTNWNLLSPNHIVSFAYCLCSIFFLKNITNSNNLADAFFFGLVGNAC